MNLLEDYKEKKEEPIIDEQFSDESSAYLEENEDYKTDVRDFHRTSEYSSYNQRKKTMLPILAFVLVIITVILVLFWGDLWKGDKIPDTYFQTTEQPTEEKTDDQTLQPSEEQPKEERDVLDRAASERTETKDVLAQESKARRPVLPPSSVASVSTTTAGLALVSNVMSVFLQTAESIQVEALILDDYSIEAEISAKSRNELETFFSNLKEKLPGNLSFSPSPTASSEAKGLLIGMLGDPVSIETLKSDQAPATVLQELRTLSDRFDLKFIEGSMEKRLSRDGYTITPLYIKCRGLMPACNAYLAEISKRQFKIKVSKVLLIANHPEFANFVLRFKVINAS